MAEKQDELLRQREQLSEKNRDIVPIVRNEGTRNFSLVFYDINSQASQSNQLNLFDFDARANITTIRTGHNEYSLTLLHDSESKVKITDAEQALNDTILTAFASQADYRYKEKIEEYKCSVYIDVKDLMRFCEKDEEYIKNKRSKLNFKNQIKKAMTNLRRIEERWKNDKTQEFYSGGRIAGFGFHKDVLVVDFNPRFAKQLLQQSGAVLGGYNNKLLKYALDNQGRSKAKSFAYRLGRYFTAHSSIDNNIKLHRDGIYKFKISTIAEQLKFELQTKTKYHAERDIVNPICEALDMIKNDGVLLWWKFTDKEDNEITGRELQVMKTRYSDFISKYLVVEVKDKNPLRRLIAEPKENPKG